MPSCCSGRRVKHTVTPRSENTGRDMMERRGNERDASQGCQGVTTGSEASTAACGNGGSSSESHPLSRCDADASEEEFAKSSIAIICARAAVCKVQKKALPDSRQQKSGPLRSGTLTRRVRACVTIDARDRCVAVSRRCAPAHLKINRARNGACRALLTPDGHVAISRHHLVV